LWTFQTFWTLFAFAAFETWTKASWEKKSGNMLTSKMMLFAAQAMLKSESCTPPWAMQPEDFTDATGRTGSPWW